MEGEEMEIDTLGNTEERLPFSSVRQLLDQWHVKPDGSLEQRIASSDLESETPVPAPSELLTTSINSE